MPVISQMMKKGQETRHLADYALEKTHQTPDSLKLQSSLTVIVQFVWLKPRIT